jgi:hypothetical protein
VYALCRLLRGTAVGKLRGALVGKKMSDFRFPWKLDSLRVPTDTSNKTHSIHEAGHKKAVAHYREFCSNECNRKVGATCLIRETIAGSRAARHNPQRSPLRWLLGTPKR